MPWVDGEYVMPGGAEGDDMFTPWPDRTEEDCADPLCDECLPRNKKRRLVGLKSSTSVSASPKKVDAPASDAKEASLASAADPQADVSSSSTATETRAATASPNDEPSSRTEQHAIYIRVTPPTTSSDSEVQKAIASQSAAWGGLHITVTGFALPEQAATSPLASSDLDVHGSSLSDVVRSAADILGRWRPGSLKCGTRRIQVDSSQLLRLEQMCRQANLARVKDARRHHISIGDADASAVLAALEDAATRWEIGVAVVSTASRSSEKTDATFERFLDARTLWP